MSRIQYTLRDLPYAYDALEPVISKEIVTLHHDKHHASYVNGANDALMKLEQAREGKLEINHKSVMRDLSFNINGHILHSIFWMNLRPPQNVEGISEELTQLLSESFGSVEAFKAEFSAAAKGVEGSGWAVLGADYLNNLVIHQVEKHNMYNLVSFDPILVLDVWEHAYYIDYKNDRGAYVDAFWKIVNWDDINNRLFGCECCHDNECEDSLNPNGCCGNCS